MHARRTARDRRPSRRTKDSNDIRSSGRSRCNRTALAGARADRCRPSRPTRRARPLQRRMQQDRLGVLDSGIDGDHPAFRTQNGESRASREASISRNSARSSASDNLEICTNGDIETRLKRCLGERCASLDRSRAPKQADRVLTNLAEDAQEGRPIHWELRRRRSLRSSPTTTPASQRPRHACRRHPRREQGRRQADKLAAKSSDCRRRHVSGHQALRLPRARRRTQGHRVRRHRGAAVHPLPERARTASLRFTAPI